MSHVDLFSGIGGFALAASRCGIDTVQFVEIDERCRAFLAKRWPGVPIHDDIRTFDGTQHRGAFLLTGGVPCQPASRAGKQKGASDDRWLWPEAIRVLGEVNPAWALFENPPGIGDVGLAGILAEMESLGYQVRVFGIPACAVGAHFQGDRYWIVSHSSEANGVRREGKRDTQEQDGSYSWRASEFKRLVRLEVQHGVPAGKSGRISDGISGRTHKLRMLGNSIVPQVAYQIIKAMILTDREGEK